jgi:hypothetical protein
MIKSSWLALSRVLVAVIVMAIWSACTDNFVSGPDELASGAHDPAGTPSVPVSDGGIVPYIISGANPGGNRTCTEASVALGYGYDVIYYTNSSGKKDYNNDGFPGNQLVVGPITVTVTDGKYISWTSTVPVKAAFIVKGSNDANIYYYEHGCWSGDSGLASPEAGQSGGSAGLSNLTVCYKLCEEPPVCVDDETAWAAGSKYVNRGNWATYTKYDYSAKTETLFAGQTLNAGTVHFSAPDANHEVTITINLNAGWIFDSRDEEDDNVKIQDYASAPSGNPSPGLFAHKFKATGSSWSGKVPKNKFYGVHADVLREVSCPE